MLLREVHDLTEADSCNRSSSQLLSQAEGIKRGLINLGAASSPYERINLQVLVGFHICPNRQDPWGHGNAILFDGSNGFWVTAYFQISIFCCICGYHWMDTQMEDSCGSCQGIHLCNRRNHFFLDSPLRPLHSNDHG